MDTHGHMCTHHLCTSLLCTRSIPLCLPSVSLGASSALGQCPVLGCGAGAGSDRGGGVGGGYWGEEDRQHGPSVASTRLRPEQTHHTWA